MIRHGSRDGPGSGSGQIIASALCVAPFAYRRLKVESLRLAGEDGPALLLLDRELGSRRTQAPV